ncbi:hypothetical protein [Arthrobacter sp. A5]|uniref:hypothetical protein n=1 Tax=Arthrobacter sp. A5 TaxID=576926 RepID=UPI003DA821C5
MEKFRRFWNGSFDHLDEALAISECDDAREGFLDNEILRLQFHDHGGKTRITLQQGPFTPRLRDMNRDGWNESFIKLDAVLAGVEA